MILQKLLLVTYGVVVWVLISVLSIFCIINILIQLKYHVESQKLQNALPISNRPVFSYFFFRLLGFDCHLDNTTKCFRYL